VLRCFIYVLESLGELFWENRGDDYPQVVLAGVKDNPTFLELLCASDVTDSPPWFLSWLIEFMRTAWSLHAFDDLLAKVADFLCEELQHERFKNSRPMSMCVASKVRACHFSFECLC